jgi:hypothetical protein
MIRIRTRTQPANNQQAPWTPLASRVRLRSSRLFWLCPSSEPRLLGVRWFQVALPCAALVRGAKDRGSLCSPKGAVQRRATRLHRPPLTHAHTSTHKHGVFLLRQPRVRPLAGQRSRAAAADRCVSHCHWSDRGEWGGRASDRRVDHQRSGQTNTHTTQAGLGVTERLTFCRVERFSLPAAGIVCERRCADRSSSSPLRRPVGAWIAHAGAHIADATSIPAKSTRKSTDACDAGHFPSLARCRCRRLCRLITGQHQQSTLEQPAGRR